MNDKDLIEICEALASKTEKKQAVWNKTVSTNTYKLALKSGSITIEMTQKGELRLRLFNTDGIPVDYAFFEEPEERTKASTEAIAVYKLYTAVVESIFRKKATLSDMKSEIFSEAQIGSEDEEDDDTPF